MATLAADASSREVTAPVQRIASVDVFRGLTMVVMIFVNDLADVRGLPWWTYHAHANQDVMTYVDMVFPFFLFAVGLSLPIAVRARLRKSASIGALLWHVFSRSAGLVVLGLLLANAEKGDPARMALSPSAWALLGLAGAVLFWHVPSSDPRRRRFSVYLRVAGLALLCITFALFRRATPTGSAGWIDGSYPEILGLIGYSYFSAAILFIVTRRWIWAPLVWMAALLALCSEVTLHHFHLHLPLYFWPVGMGGMTSIIMAGVCTSNIFFAEQKLESPARQFSLAGAFALACAFAGWLLTPLGISKIRETPTWCLYSTAAAIAMLTLLYWICDRMHKTRWAAPIHPAGANTLLTYLLPDIYYYLAALLGFTYLDTHLNFGIAGVMRSIAFVLVILGVSAVATRARLRLQL